MSSYLDSLNSTQKNNAAILVERMKANGITNPLTHSAVLAVVYKESAFNPQSENLNYRADTIARVFSRVPKEMIAKLAGNPQALGNYVYGPSYNNNLGNGPNEGFKYRGRGYNQITGKANYKKIGDQIGVDLVSNPDKLNDPKVAADAAIIFFKNGITALSKTGKLSQYNATNINDFKTQKDSLGAIYHVNAGIGSTKAKIDADVTGGKKKAESVVDDLFFFVNKGVRYAKRNPITTALVTASTIVLGYVIIKQLVKK